MKIQVQLYLPDQNHAKKEQESRRRLSVFPEESRENDGRTW